MKRLILLSLLLTVLLCQSVSAATLFVEADVDGDNIAAVTDAIEMYPQSVVDTLTALGWSVVLTDMDLSTYSNHEPGSLIYGLTDSNYKHCYVSSAIATNEFTTHVALHEFAHAIDFTTNLSSQDFVTTEMAANAERFPTFGSAITAPREYYAECWAYYYLDHEFLQSVSPVMFNHCQQQEAAWRLQETIQ